MGQISGTYRQIEDLREQIAYDGERLKTIEAEIEAIGARCDAELAIKKQQAAMIRITIATKQASIDALESSAEREESRISRRARFQPVNFEPKLPIGSMDIIEPWEKEAAQPTMRRQ